MGLERRGWMISSERKKFEIRRSRTAPRGEKALANVVRIFVQGHPEHCIIRFSPAFEEFVGKTLPMGVGVHRPAYIAIQERKGWYLIQAAYIHSPHEFYTLWKTRQMPEWTQEKPNGNTTTSSTGGYPDPSRDDLTREEDPWGYYDTGAPEGCDETAERH